MPCRAKAPRRQQAATGVAWGLEPIRRVPWGERALCSGKGGPQKCVRVYPPDWGAGALQHRRRSANAHGSGINTYGQRHRIGQQWVHRTGGTSNGRHATQSGSRSALTAGPCSNSLVLIFRFPGPPADPPMHRPRCPRVHGHRSHGCHGPRCRLPQLRPPTQPLIVHRSRSADDSLMVTAWRHGLRAPRPAAFCHHPSPAPIGPSSPQLSPIPRARSQQGSGFSMGQIRSTAPQDPAANRPAPG